MNKFFYFAVVNLLCSLGLFKAQTVTLSNNLLGQSAVYTFNYTTTVAIGNGTDTVNVFYFSTPSGYPAVSPIVSGGNNLQPYVTFKVNGVSYPCNTAFGIGGSWSSGVQLSVGGASTGVSIPAGAQIQVIVSGLLKNPTTAGAYMLNWRTAKASGTTVQEFNVPVSFSSTLSTQESVKNSNEVSVYPNPAADYIQVSGLTKAGKYKIYNVSGNLVNEGTVSGNEKLNVNNLVSGSYFVNFENGKTVKFIKK